ncbi:MAG: phosphoglycerate kinase [Rhodospirillaceae bacterium]|nr:phosphoglycerate kinase [Rhodospirillaceae bacterium]MBT7291793.1 phosphoglycerate kinase [Rhodospirillaceae bacterium]
MSAFRTLDDLKVSGKKVLVRADLNVPITDGAVSDSSRIDSVAPTLVELADKGAKVIVLSHFGRPKGRRVPAMSLAPLAPHVSAALGGRNVAFAPDCVGSEARQVVEALGDGDVALLENTRFHAGEEKNDAEFAATLAALGDIYVNDAFSAAHRAHASTTGVAHLLPNAAGRLMQGELEALESALLTPEHPVVAVVGGAKVSTKIDLLVNLIERVDVLVIGGGMANTFLHAGGTDIGASLCEKALSETANTVRDKAAASGCRLLLPSDGVVAREFVQGAASEICAISDIPPDGMILDLGPQTVAAIEDAIGNAKTVVWNGPLGAFEIPPFDAATNAAARAAAKHTRDGGLLSVAGGGDTVAALRHAGVTDDFSYISMAGGAFLEWLEGKALPGVEALKDQG